MAAGFFNILHQFQQIVCILPFDKKIIWKPGYFKERISTVFSDLQLYDKTYNS